SDLSHKFIDRKDLTVFNSVNELSSFPRFSFIRSASDTMYYAGLYPYSSKIDIYRYADKENKLIKHLHIPYQVESDLNALVLHDGKHIAVLGGVKGGLKNIYIYQLYGSDNTPVAVINNVLNYQILSHKDGSFFFTRDAFASKGTVLGVNSIFQCNYKFENDELIIEEEKFYIDLKGRSGYIFDVAYDEIGDHFYTGEYSYANPDEFGIFEVVNSKPVSLYSLKSTNDEQYRLAGADDQNLYILGVDPTIKGTLYALNRNTLRLDTVINNPTMDVNYFSLIKDKAVIYFQNEKSNRAYVIDKHSLAVREIPVDENGHYKFYHNKKSDQIYYQKQSLIQPKEIFAFNTDNFEESIKVSHINQRPFNPDDYVIEQITYKSLTGDDINLHLTYKKGLVRNSSNPMIVLTYVNAENSYLDKFNMSRTLYMDYGFIFAQRAQADSRTDINMENRADDVFSTYKHLIDEGYTSPEKMAFIGREFGASALLEAMNKYPMKSTAVMVDGLFDFVKYNNKGKLLYYNQKLFQANDSASFKSVFEMSPYHNVVNNKNYPSILFITTDKNNVIPEDHTYKLVARMQMRTKARNPIIMLTPDYVDKLDEYERYTYKMFIEHALIFIANQLNVKIN
ncbi:MAG: prolyl oligopeptidase family serine peptidase, partial [Bacteroidales bacterium]